MSDEKYLKKRRGAWYLQVAIPMALRGRPPYGNKKVIVRSLGTDSLRQAQARRWPLLAELRRAFDLALTGGGLTLAEVEFQARQVYRDALKEFAAAPFDEEQRLVDYSAAMFNQEFEHIADDLEAIRQRTGAALEVGSPTWRLVGETAAAARWRALLARQQAKLNKIVEPPAIFVEGGIDLVTLKPIIPLRAPAAPAGGATFPDVAQLYFDEKETPAGAKPRTHARLFADHLDGAPIASVTRRDVSTFLDLVQRLDPKWGSRKIGIENPTFAQITEKLGGTKPQMSSATLEKWISTLSNVFRFARRRGLCQDNPASDQARAKPKGETGYVPFEVPELNTLFSAPVPVGPYELALRWAPAISLFSGCRVGEVLQLRREDIRQDPSTGIWFTNVTDRFLGQSLKTKAARRVVPIHSALVAAGFLKFVDAADGWLFPGDLAPSMPQTFGRWKRRHGLRRPRTVFHSLRKNFVTALDQAAVTASDIAALVGHGRGSLALNVYSSGPGLRRLSDLVELVQYPGLEIAHRRPSPEGLNGLHRPKRSA